MIEHISNIFAFAGGLGMFLYGMHIMAEGMQKTAGGRLQKFLGLITNNRVVAIGVGALITAIIQSSSATTVMVVGFVSGGILTLSQAVGVIMGANIGTTITAWLVSINEIGAAFDLMKPEFYAPAIVGVGALIIIFSSSEKKKTVAEIILGLGLLFLGLKYMSGSISAYRSSPIFVDAFAILGQNPLLGILVGTLVTALIQSSSASVGILQTLAMSGIVNFSSAIFITLGQNIGTCVTAMISSIGGSRTAKRAAAIHLSFNVIGAIVFGILGFIYFGINKSMAQSTIDSVGISMFHTVFNLTMTVLLFPFADWLVKLSGVIVKKSGKGEISIEDRDQELLTTLKHLDTRIFETPAFALETVTNEVVRMGELAMENVKEAMNAELTSSKESIEKILKTEQTINAMQQILTEYLIKVDNLALSEHQKMVVSSLFYTVSDFERIADHAENIAENMKLVLDKGMALSETALEDLRTMNEYVLEAVRCAIDARKTGSLEAVRNTNKYEDMVDNLEIDLREKHIERLSDGSCKPEAGVIFLDLLSNLERISDHATNIAGYVSKEA